MRPQIIDAFRDQGITSIPEIKIAVKEAKEDLFSQGQITALEIQWKKKMIDSGEICKCGRKDMLTVDHLVPKHILIDMGFDARRQWMPENFVLMCRPCNALKSGHLDFSNPKTKEILLNLLEKI